MGVIYLVLVLLDLLSKAPIAEALSLSLSASVLVNYVVGSAVIFITISLNKCALLLIALRHTVSIMVGRLLRCIIGRRLHGRVPTITQAIVAVL